MFNRTSKMTALLVAAAAVTSLVPASAATKLGTKEGKIENAIAFDGTYIYEGYKTDEDIDALYFNNGKDRIVDEDNDYSYNELKDRYGNKYVVVEDGEKYLLDLSTGKILDDESISDKEENIKFKLNKSLKKTDRYDSTTPSSVNIIKGGSSNELWYEYAVTTGSSVVLSGFTNESGKYIDSSILANMTVVTTDAAVKVSKFNEKETKQNTSVKLSLAKAPKVIDQDNNYIYTLTTVNVEINGKSDEDRVYIQKISKAQGETKDGAYMPKSVTSYEVSDKLKINGKNTDTSAAESLLLDENNIVRVIKDTVYVTEVDDSVTVSTISLKQKTVTADSDKRVTANVALKDDDDTVDDVYDVSIDAEGNTWALNKGKIYKFDGSEFKQIYTCDRSLNKLDVYNEKNLIAWCDEDEDDLSVYAVVSEGKVSTDEEAGNTEEDKTEDSVVKSGWDKNADETWSYYKNGAKATGWVLDGSNWYYLNANGIMQTGWVLDNGTWYYLNPVSNGYKGAMKTGWVLDGGNWYYLQSNGAMKTGWFQDTDGRWYYLNANGSMAANTTVGGYKLGANGAWIR